ncbi:MAG TPA: GNAT family N-acetyltransferase [Halomonas sp.]|nr:GNAT family N-acetyltransferase [Halomonas sp.]
MLSAQQASAAARLLGRGMRDNPTHVQAFGSDPARRERTLRRMFTPFVRQQMRSGVALGAFLTSPAAASDASPALVGVASMSAPGRCQPSLASKLLALPAFLHGGGPRAALRMRAWVRIWAGRDKQAPMHWHLGPLAVEPHHQGRGIGSALLERLCAHLDRHQALGYLETDRVENVRLYQRFGFDTVASEEVIGTPHWFMQREPASRQAS